MLISAQMVQAQNTSFVNVYVYAHDSTEWPADPVEAFELPMALQDSYEAIEAGGNLILGAVDVVCPNETEPLGIYAQFREYAANLPLLDNHPPFVWSLPPFALRFWVQPNQASDWQRLLLELLRHILLP
ncbi:MAG TPA: hypothetical protein VK034_14705 [Enhygromyxa sp.]|nr:hypothetical protein [Enhygromyxa sp.]